MQQTGKWLLTGLLAGGTLVPAGCNAPRNPWQFTPPPAATMSGSTTTIEAGRPTVVVGRFDDPTRAPAYAQGSGAAIANALARSLLNRETHNVLIRHDVDEVPGSNRHVSSQRSSKPHHGELSLSSHVADQIDETVHYLITGKVTDFYHTTDLHEEISRWGVFGRRREAIVALELRVVDVKSERVLLTEKFNATASLNRGSDAAMYDSVALDSYVFWSTPLGRAARRAVERASSRVEAVLPKRFGPPEIVQLIEPRRVEIRGGSRDGLRVGRDYYLFRHNARSEQWQPVADGVTGAPLTVRILRLDQDTATGWLQGVPSDSRRLRGTVLMRTLPPAVDKASSPSVEANIAASMNGSDHPSE